MTLSKPDSPGNRLHPSSPLFLLIHALIRFVLPILIGVIFGTRYGSDTGDWLLFGFAIIATLGSILQYWYYRYWLEPDRIVVQSGIFFKSLRQVPYKKIQNLNIERSLLHRLVGVATVQIESASGSKPEATIRVIHANAVQHLNNAIQNKPHNTSKTQQLSNDQETVEKNINSNEPLIHHMSNTEVVKYGLISHKALFPIGVLVTLFFQNEGLQDVAINWLKQRIGLFHISTWGWQDWLLYSTLGLISALLAVWLLSIILAFLQLYNFRLKQDKTEQKMTAQMGLLTDIKARIPIRRIQLIRFKQSPLHRFFKRYSIKMETAGGVTEQTGITMRWIAPLIEPEEGKKLIAQLIPSIDLQQTIWNPLEQRAWKRVFKKSLLWLTLPLIILGFIHLWGAMTLMIISITFAYFYAKAYIRHAAYTNNDKIIAFRDGVFFRTTSIVLIEKIQNITVTQNPFDHLNQMARIKVDTAGSGFNIHKVDIPYLNYSTVKNIQHQLTELVNNQQFKW